MRKRPLSVTIISWIYIVVGVGGIAAHSTEFNLRRPFEADLLTALVVRLLAIVAGIFMLREQNWARWLAVAWIAFHVALSSLHSLPAAVMHALLLAIFTFFLFRPKASAYFRDAGTGQLSSGNLED